MFRMWIQNQTTRTTHSRNLMCAPGKALSAMQDDYRECAKSMLTCVWVLSLFGAEQLARLLTPREALMPRYITKLTFEMMQQSAEVCRVLTPGRENRLAWQELQNK